MSLLQMQTLPRKFYKYSLNRKMSLTEVVQLQDKKFRILSNSGVVRSSEETLRTQSLASRKLELHCANMGHT